MTQIYWACGPTRQNFRSAATAVRGGRTIATLIAFPFLKRFDQRLAENPATAAALRPLMLDSGAFSVWNSGKQIDLAALIAVARQPRWSSVVGLDVVGDPAASLANVRTMRAAGLTVMPVFHIGEPWTYLTTYCAEFATVGLSCRFGEPPSQSLAWLAQCFARGWPHRFHSFGWTSPIALRRFPFASADSSSWTYSAQGFGKWHAFGGKALGLHGSAWDGAADMEYFLRLEAELQQRWRAALATIPEVAWAS